MRRTPTPITRLLRLLLLVAVLVPAFAIGAPVHVADALDPGFQDSLVTNVAAPTALAFTPDGRMLITTQPGQLRVYMGGALLPIPALDLADGGMLCKENERGLLGVAVDPNFATNHFIYLYYTRITSPGAACTANVMAYNRVSRWTLSNENVASDETVLIDEIASPFGNHNGGDLNFGKDGFLYVSVGDGGSTPQTAQQLHSLNGKILRIKGDGGIPDGNPYRGTDSVRCNENGGTGDTGKKCREIFAYGLRNPFRMGFDPNAATTRFFINDVGQNAWEEIDNGQNGANYGWDCREGNHPYRTTDRCSPPPSILTGPIYEYGRGTGCSSITGAAFVPNGVWPASYDGAYMFADYVCGKIFTLRETSPGTWTRSDFVTGLGSSSAVHLRFGPWNGPNGATQALYYTNYADGGEIRRIGYANAVNNPPTAALIASPRFGGVPLRVDFDGRASTDPDPGNALTWEWDFGDGTTTTTTVPTVSHTYTTAAIRTATLRVRDGGGLRSDPATVQIGAGAQAPNPTILSPATGTPYTPGQSYLLTGGATDPEDGTLPDGQLSWQVLLHHNEHTHPVLGPVSGNAITFNGPIHDEGTNWLEIRLTATDAQGLSATTTRAMRLGGASFSDVPPSDPGYEAISELAARGIIQGYGDGTFGPADISLRAQMAGLIVRAMGWGGDTATNPFPDRGPVDDELWAAVGILAARGVTLGYEDGTYDPTGPVLHLQVVSFISRAMVERGYWTAATEDDPSIYPNVQVALSDRLDLVTYVRNAGAVPDRPLGANWDDWNTPASRGWFARVLWQALEGR
ncbi:MAG TPA: PQQ-dependent sugar dehydrogenase [Thermomicrobiales bacterium]|jgi:glucose/arabinose dehydrogenase